MTDIALQWLIFGFVLVMAELLISGLIILFLGIGAMIVALLIWLGLLESFLSMFGLWVIISLVLAFTLRDVIGNFLPSGSEIGNLDEDQDARGKVVIVITTVTPYNNEGRIEFRGTTWPACCPEATLSPGSQAVLVKRNLDVWVVSPHVSSKRI